MKSGDHMERIQSKLKKYKIAVIGLGRIGKLVSKLLMSYSNISEIMIYTTSEHMGYIEELYHINAFGIRISVLPTMEKIREADYIIISSSVDYSKLIKGKTIEDEWKIELQHNVEIIRSILSKLYTVSGKNFLIYTNPVDVVSHIVYEKLGRHNKIYGFGVNLDTMRLRNMVNKSGYVIGEHGISMVPAGVSPDLNILKDTRNILIKSVSTVTRHQGFTSVGPEIASLCLFNALFKNEDTIVPLSIYHEEHGIFYGWPLEIKAGEFSKRQIELNHAEKEMLKQSIEKINLDIKEVYV